MTEEKFVKFDPQTPYKITNSQLRVMPFYIFIETGDDKENPDQELCRQIIKNNPNDSRVTQNGFTLSFRTNANNWEPLCNDNQPLIFKNVAYKKDLAPDENGLITLNYFHYNKNHPEIEEQNTKTAIISPAGKILRSSNKVDGIFNVGQNYYYVQGIHGRGYYCALQGKNDMKTINRVSQIPMGKNSRKYNYLLNFENYYHDLPQNINTLELPTNQSPISPYKFTNGFVYSEFFEKDKARECLISLGYHFMDKEGNLYKDLKSLVEADIKRRRNNETPIIENLDLLVSDLKGEVLAIEAEVRKTFGKIDIGERNQHNIPSNLLDKAKIYRASQVYLDSIADFVAEKIAEFESKKGPSPF
ncbi:MAG: hypothetical protein IJX26_04670 [Clostridia bacterium]|nr:hypothetical protein [Clostridia bacterium]